MPRIPTRRLRQEPNFALEYISNGLPVKFIGSLMTWVYEGLKIVCTPFGKAQVVATSNSVATCTET